MEMARPRSGRKRHRLLRESARRVVLGRHEGVDETMKQVPDSAHRPSGRHRHSPTIRARLSGCKTRCERGYLAKTLRCQLGESTMSKKFVTSILDSPFVALPGENKCAAPYIGERIGENGVGGKWLMGTLLRIALTLMGHGNGVVGG